MAGAAQGGEGEGVGGASSGGGSHPREANDDRAAGQGAARADPAAARGAAGRGEATVGAAVAAAWRFDSLAPPLAPGRHRRIAGEGSVACGAPETGTSREAAVGRRGAASRLRRAPVEQPEHGVEGVARPGAAVQADHDHSAQIRCGSTAHHPQCCFAGPDLWLAVGQIWATSTRTKGASGRRGRASRRCRRAGPRCTAHRARVA